MANGKFVARSMHVKMKWYFFLDSGSGPTMSTANLSSLSVIISGWHNGALVPPDLLLSWHFLQSRMCFWTSLLNPGQVKCLLMPKINGKYNSKLTLNN